MLLAELEVFHSRPIAPTRRVALGRDRAAHVARPGLRRAAARRHRRQLHRRRRPRPPRRAHPPHPPGRGRSAHPPAPPPPPLPGRPGRSHQVPAPADRDRRGAALRDPRLRRPPSPTSSPRSTPPAGSPPTSAPAVIERHPPGHALAGRAGPGVRRVPQRDAQHRQLVHPGRHATRWCGRSASWACRRRPTAARRCSSGSGSCSATPTPTTAGAADDAAQRITELTEARRILLHG